MNDKWKWIALGQIIGIVLIIAAIGFTREMNDNPIQSGRSILFSDTLADGLTGTIAAGTSVHVENIPHILFELVEGATTVFTVQASYDNCSTYSTLNTFTASTVAIYRNLMADCVRVNTSWTAGTQTVRVRGGN